MSEREPHYQDDDPYWQEDIAVGDGQVQGEQHTIRMRIHTSVERYSERREIYPLQYTRGERHYVMAKPYILFPSITVSFAASATPTPEGAIGEVVSSEWEGMRHQDIGHAQGWYYPADRILVLWECYLFEWVRKDNPVEDETFATVWNGFERVLLQRFPDAARLVTPAIEPIYEEQADSWPEFLGSQGYQPSSKEALVKPVLNGGEGEVARP